MRRGAILGFHLLGGFVWLVILGAAANALGGTTVAWLWTLPAGVVWAVVANRIASGSESAPGAASFSWWLVSFAGPCALVLLRSGRAAPHALEEVDVNTDELSHRLDVVESRLASLQHELAAIRGELRSRARPAPAPVAAAPSPPPPPRPAAPPQAAAVPPRPRRELDLADLLGAKALAWAGGVVTLLGVVFFFVLAVNRGWIGPGLRVALGAAASAIVFTGGVWLRRRFGETHSALAAVGAGIAGGYATLAAATVLYDFVSNPVALALAAGIAVAGLTVSLVWRAELVAALGLVGAILVPALLATEGGLTATGTAFAAVMTAAAAAVGVRMRWRWLLTSAGVASAPQVVALVAHAQRHDGAVFTVACVFAVVYLAAGIADRLADREAGLGALPTSLVLGSIAIVWLAAAHLFGPGGGVQAGIALLTAAAVFGAAAVALRAARERELSTLLGTISLAAAAAGVADALSGATLAYLWAAEAAALAVAARRVREPRLQLGALAYLGLAGAHALLVDAPPYALVVAARHPASGALALAAAAAAAVVVARSSREPLDAGPPERGVLAFLGPVLDGLGRYRQEIALLAGAGAAAFAVDAASLGVLQLFETLWRDGGVIAAFHRGHVALTALWSLAGVAGVVVALRRGSADGRALAFAWLALTALKTVAYDGTQLDGIEYSIAFGATAAGLLAVGYLREVLDTRPRPAWETIAAVGAAISLALAALRPLGDTTWLGGDARGFGMLAIAAVLAALAASVAGTRRLRDLRTLLWAPAAGLAAVAAAILVHGRWLVLAWAAGTAGLALLAVLGREKRFRLASLAYLVLTAAAAAAEAPPTHLLVAHRHPGSGLDSVVLLIGASLAFAWAAGRERLRSWSLWAAAVLTVYAASLGILELAIDLSSAGLHTDFQRGHTAVSALWGMLGLALLYIGLTRGRRALRLGGFALFGVSLGKLFLYDLSQLSSVTRALSFLAVGSGLLLAGFFYQRLGAEPEQRGVPSAL